eukprot:GEZU01002333.1.p1 GENE.GEZU01002333.1~~GEZU01002333.1.p1  ORF type:complete len:206 (+),score=67.57 GEZU01002333.1:2-619(+)
MLTLEETAQVLHEELEKKTKIVQYYMQREKVGRIGVDSEKEKIERAKKQSTTSFMGSLFAAKPAVANPDVSAEMAQKMQKVMEETLLHNIQLQTDIATLGNEISRLMDENKALKARLPAGRALENDNGNNGTDSNNNAARITKPAPTISIAPPSPSSSSSSSSSPSPSAPQRPPSSAAAATATRSSFGTPSGGSVTPKRSNSTRQ